MKEGKEMIFKNTAEKDRHYICEIGRLFWGEDKQCYAGDAVYRKVKSLFSESLQVDEDEQSKICNKEPKGCILFNFGECSHGCEYYDKKCNK